MIIVDKFLKRKDKPHSGSKPDGNFAKRPFHQSCSNPNGLNEQPIPVRKIMLVIVSGTIAMLAGIASWGILVAFTFQPSGFMALLSGIFVGIAVRIAGKGFNQRFGNLSAGLTIFGVVAGKWLELAIYLPHRLHLSFEELISQVGLTTFIQVGFGSLKPMDLVWLTLAAMLAYNITHRKLNKI